MDLLQCCIENRYLCIKTILDVNSDLDSSTYVECEADTVCLVGNQQVHHVQTLCTESSSNPLLDTLFIHPAGPTTSTRPLWMAPYCSPPGLL